MSNQFNARRTIIIRDPAKPRKEMRPSELAVKISEDRRKVERAIEERELRDECKEVWD